MAGFIFFRGPSPIDGAPIVAIATLKSANAKTGDMVQTWILREDISPLDAIATGADASICGNCSHRGDAKRKRICYVDVGKAPMGVWNAFHRGQYIDLSNDPGTVAILIAQRIVRMGAYGDPAMVPVAQWRMLLAGSAGRTGYTHAWRRMWAQALKPYVMASADSVAEQDLARSMGWRTFRVRSESEPLQSNEFACPASPEAGNKKQCITCKACDGADRPGKASAAIIVHGKMAKHFMVAA
ncbi:hypothetical protein UFOVP839_39 [uncultured Caudovirales phage]|uniref:Uncharacterized protein n=1 Tax=uncultured Caudovirales phage TaxID=2100421 RepID=A0A6J5SUP6_9CAUD|nr:hypothetical protein UFOVP839_39 [uncultured Caudovirales phage]CAB4183599.1 hypothetical protein UFOVP1100_30 [uncultured Caudovirales phage]CAB4214374.1 hypothetical protein UFOVP1461_33 [uncultured Caudovirales phage]CAB4219272.1 hypothetical protein UFOVP1612_17 [uncultured Caudovirales phage]